MTALTVREYLRVSKVIQKTDASPSQQDQEKTEARSSARVSQSITRSHIGMLTAARPDTPSQRVRTSRNSRRSRERSLRRRHPRHLGVEQGVPQAEASGLD